MGQKVIIIGQPHHGEVMVLLADELNKLLSGTENDVLVTTISRRDSVPDVVKIIKAHKPTYACFYDERPNDFFNQAAHQIEHAELCKTTILAESTRSEETFLEIDVMPISRELLRDINNNAR